MSDMKTTFLPFTTVDGQLRLAVLIDEQIVCRAPSLKPDTVRHTTPGSVVWVLSEGSKSLLRLERQLKDGSRVCRPVTTKTARAKVEKSVITGVSFLSEKELAELTEERAGMAVAYAAKAAARVRAAARVALGAGRAGPTQAQMDSMMALVRAAQADPSGDAGTKALLDLVKSCQEAG